MGEIKQPIKNMTLEQKASLLSGEDFWSTRAIPSLNISQMFMADGPHGLRKQAKDGDHLGLVKGIKATCFPTSATVANSWDTELCNEIGTALGLEAAANEVNILLGPGLNVKRNPLCGRNFEYFSEDPYLSGKLAAAYIKGIQKNKIAACPKHFAANNQEYLRMTNDSVIDLRTLHEIYLTGFEIAVKEGKPLAIMSSYNKVNGTYAHENRYLLTEVLKDQWGFDGIVISDWGGANDPVKSIIAGAHLEMPTPGKDSIIKIVSAVESNELDEKLVDKTVETFLKVLDETKITNSPIVDYYKHNELAQKAAEESAVLLKNDGVLPLDSNAKVAIIGDFADKPRYQGAGSSLVNPYMIESVLDVIDDTSINAIGYAKGYSRKQKTDHSLIRDAVELAKKSDVAVIFAGLCENAESEGCDRTHLNISDSQVELIEEVSKAAPKTVVVLSGGAVIETGWDENCNAVLHGYLAGQAGAKAVLKILTGEVNPSGKLSETYPVNYEDCPNASYYPGKEATSEYREGLYVGYRYYEKGGINVKYPFGYGLSYTSFAYDNLEVNEKGIKCKITNVGDVAGSEIAQLYIGREQKGIHRPKKELKGFCKVHLKPGQSREIEMDFDEYSFRYFDVKEECFLVQGGIYKIMIGSSSEDIKLKSEILIKGSRKALEDRSKLKKYFEGDVKNITAEEFEAIYGKKLPESKWNRNKPLDINDSIMQMSYAKSFIARLTVKILLKLKQWYNKRDKPNLNLYFLTNMPFRAMVKMSNGMVSTEMAENIVLIANGHFFKGVTKLIKSYRNYREIS